MYTITMSDFIINISKRDRTVVVAEHQRNPFSFALWRRVANTQRTVLEFRKKKWKNIENIHQYFQDILKVIRIWWFTKDYNWIIGDLYSIVSISDTLLLIRQPEVTRVHVPISLLMNTCNYKVITLQFRLSRFIELVCCCFCERCSAAPVQWVLIAWYVPD